METLEISKILKDWMPFLLPNIKSTETRTTNDSKKTRQKTTHTSVTSSDWPAWYIC